MAIMYLLYWLCIYSSGDTEHNKILTLKFNLTSKVKVNHPPKQQILFGGIIDLDIQGQI